MVRGDALRLKEGIEAGGHLPVERGAGIDRDHRIGAEFDDRLDRDLFHDPPVDQVAAVREDR